MGELSPAEVITFLFDGRAINGENRRPVERDFYKTADIRVFIAGLMIQGYK